MNENIKTLYVEFIKRHKSTYIIYLIFLLSYPLERIYVPTLYSKIISKLKENPHYKIFLPLVLVWIVIQIKRYFITKMDGTLIPEFQKFVRQKVLDRFVTSLETEYVEIKHGDFLTKLIKIPDALQELFEQVKRSIFTESILVIGLVVYLGKQHPYLGLIMLGFSLCSIGSSYLYYNSCKDSTSKVENLQDGLYEHIHDVLSNILSMFSFQQKKEESIKIHELENIYIESLNKVRACNIHWKLIFSVLALSMFLGMNLCTFYLYKKKKITAEQVVSIFIIVYSHMDRVLQNHGETANYIRSIGTIDEVFGYLDSLNSGEKNQPIEQTIRDGPIVFSKVGFGYKKTNKKIFEDFNLVLPHGKKTVVIGHIGSGKSTLIKLLMKYNEYNEGLITIGGVSIRDINANQLRTLISYVPQNTILFDRTLYENITYGSTNVKEERILQVFDSLGMMDLKQKFAERMHKGVGKNGGDLSGGQRQIVWLLRAFLSNKAIIIIDEPTSSLDPESTKYVINMINMLFTGKTVLIITHDKDFIKIVDKVVMLKDGKIVHSV